MMSDPDKVSIDMITDDGDVLLQFSEPVSQEIRLHPDGAREMAENIIAAAYMADTSGSEDIKENNRTLDDF